MGDNQDSIIPQELFQPVGDVVNNLIDKLASAAGYIVTPKGKRKDKEEAIDFFIDSIKNNKQMPLLVKAVIITNARTIIKEYSNQNDIVNMAMEQIGKEYEPENIDDDWAQYFMDKAKNVSQEDMKFIFAKILLKECEHKDCISKQLLNILSIISSDVADAFKRICRYMVVQRYKDGSDAKSLFITKISNTKEHHIDVSFREIEELSNIGLINYEGLVGYIGRNDIVALEYGHSIYKLIKYPDVGCLIGYVALTSAGYELASIFEGEYKKEYEDEIELYLKNKNFEIERNIRK